MTRLTPSASLAPAWARPYRVRRVAIGLLVTAVTWPRTAYALESLQGFGGLAAGLLFIAAFMLAMLLVPAVALTRLTPNPVARAFIWAAVAGILCGTQRMWDAPDHASPQVLAALPANCTVGREWAAGLPVFAVAFALFLLVQQAWRRTFTMRDGAWVAAGLAVAGAAEWRWRRPLESRRAAALAVLNAREREMIVKSSTANRANDAVRAILAPYEHVCPDERNHYPLTFLDGESLGIRRGFCFDPSRHPFGKLRARLAQELARQGWKSRAPVPQSDGRELLVFCHQSYQAPLDVDGVQYPPSVLKLELVYDPTWNAELSIAVLAARNSGANVGTSPEIHCE